MRYDSQKIYRDGEKKRHSQQEQLCALSDSALLYGRIVPFNVFIPWWNSCFFRSHLCAAKLVTFTRVTYRAKVIGAFLHCRQNTHGLNELENHASLNSHGLLRESELILYSNNSLYKSGGSSHKASSSLPRFQSLHGNCILVFMSSLYVSYVPYKLNGFMTERFHTFLYSYINNGVSIIFVKSSPDWIEWNEKKMIKTLCRKKIRPYLHRLESIQFLYIL